MDPASREGEGRGWGERRRRRPGFFFHPGFLLPAAPAGGRGESSEPAARPSRARSGRATGARPPAAWPFPRLAAWLRSSADDPRPGRTSSRAAPRTRGPARGLLPGPRGRAEETRGRSGTILAESARARRGSRPPESPRMRDLWGGGCGWKALRWRWAWPVARAGGAVAPRAPSSLAARAAPFVDVSPAGARGGRGQPGATLRVWDSVNGAGLPSPRSLGLPQAPRPKGRGGRVRAGRGRGGGALLRSSCVRGKKWAGGRALQLVGSLSEPASPFGQNWR